MTNRKRVLWTRNSGRTESIYSGPKYDHTTCTDEGWYVYVPIDSQSDGVAILQSEIIRYGSTVCLKFFYNILDEYSINFTPKLTVGYLAPDNLTPIWKFNISDNRHDIWNNFSATFTGMPENYKFLLKTIEGNISRADVAVDDIQVMSGSCEPAFTTTPNSIKTTTLEPISEKLYDCDFESKCNWIIDSNWNTSRWEPSKFIFY
jgi:hypothetical protein